MAKMLALALLVGAQAFVNNPARSLRNFGLRTATRSPAAPQLPKMLPAALDNLDGSAALRAHLGDAFVDSYLKLRRAHWDEYAADLSPWEWRAYLDS